MGMLKSRVRNLALLSLSLLGGHDAPEADPDVPKVHVSSQCDTESTMNSLRTYSKGSVELVLAAGPNQDLNASFAMQVFSQLNDTHDHVSLTILVDEDWADRWNKPDEIPETVNADIYYQERGTSYIEIADTMERTANEHLVFFAHNKPLQWRLELAADRTVNADNYAGQLESVTVLCHDEVEAVLTNTLKELASYSLDLAGGHERTIASSRGGYRLKRFKKWVMGALQ